MSCKCRCKGAVSSRGAKGNVGATGPMNPDSGVNPELDYLEPVIDYTDTPPGGPSTDDRYLIGTAPSGAWVGHGNEVAEWDGAAWVYTVPVADDYIYVTSDLATYRFTGVFWDLQPGTAILQDGNIFGATGVRIGSNDANPVYIKYDNAPIFRMESVSTYAAFTGEGSTTGFAFLNKVNIRDSSNQLTVEYDASNRLEVRIAINGHVRLESFGSGEGFSFRNDIFVGEGVGDDIRLNVNGGALTSASTSIRAGGSTGYSFDVWSKDLGTSHIQAHQASATDHNVRFMDGKFRFYNTASDGYQAYFGQVGDVVEVLVNAGCGGDASLNVLGAAEQLRVGISSTAYWKAETDSDGLTTLTAVGTVAGSYGFVFDGTFGITYINGATQATASVGDTGSEMMWTNGVASGSYQMNAVHFQVSHSLKIVIDAPVVTFPGVPTGRGTVAAGESFYDTAANILANSDLILAKRV